MLGQPIKHPTKLRPCLNCSKIMERPYRPHSRYHTSWYAYSRRKFCCNDCRYRYFGENHKGENNPNWKGGNPVHKQKGYEALHKWVIYHLGQPTKCEHCGKDGLSGIKIHWANISGVYERNLDDWVRLCSKCHKQYDK